MPIEDFYARSEADVVTFSRNQVHFSASLVKSYGLDQYEYIRIGIDSEMRRIYFSFQKESGPGVAKFYRQTGRSNRKMFAAGGLYSKYDWLAALKQEKDKGKKQFILEEVNHEQNDIYPKYKFFITIGYSWSEERDFHNPKQYPEEPGVYRLKKDGEIVRIGESINIHERLRVHFKDYGNEVDSYDFEIVPNDDERKKEEKRLLESFKEAVGRLPRLNILTK
jgi:hypothetical protein